MRETNICAPLWTIVLFSPIIFIWLVWEFVSGKWREDFATVYTQYNTDGSIKKMWAVNHKGEVRELC